MTTQIEAMKNALAAMEHSQEVMLNECGIGYIDVRAITALRAAIEAAEKVEPSAWISTNTSSGECCIARSKITSKYEGLYEWQPLYLHPPSAEIEELRKDAARYRWLRQQESWHPDITNLDPPHPVRVKWVGGPYSEVEIDSLIDAAMKEKQP